MKIVVLDAFFSLDSVITAVVRVRHLYVVMPGVSVTEDMGPLEVALPTKEKSELPSKAGT